MIYVMFVLGLVGLFFGGEFLVRGSVGVARRLNVAPLIIGLTIVGFGTSTPELLVSVQAALAGAPAIAIGNVIGSNIANILLILGITAIIAPVAMPLRRMERDYVVMIGATVALWGIMIGGWVSRLEGAFLFAGLAVYLFISLRSAGGSADPATESEIAATPAMPLWKGIGLALAGLLVLMLGAKFLVDSATEIARTFGVSEAVIGLTIVAIGTSLPELATAAMAAWRGHPEIAVGNIVGSCIFNILGILGLTALVTPIPVDPRFAGIDLFVALAAAIAMLGLAAWPKRSGRRAGLALLAAYAGYTAYLAAS